MFSFKKKIQGTAEIQLENNSNRVLWRSNEDIAGCVVYKLPPGVEFSHSKVILKGIKSTPNLMVDPD